MKNIAIFANLALIGFAIFLYFDIETIDTKDIKVIGTFIIVPIISVFVICCLRFLKAIRSSTGIIFSLRLVLFWFPTESVRHAV